jgi:hypothetical protein
LIPGREDIFSSSECPYRSVVEPTHDTYSVGTGVVSGEVKWLGREADHSSLSDAEVKRENYTYTPP